VRRTQGRGAAHGTPSRCGGRFGDAPGSLASLDAAGLKAGEGHGGAVTLIQRFGSAGNLNIHLHGLLLDGVYRCGADGVPEFVEVGSPTDDEVRALLQTLIARLMKMLTRRDVLVEDTGQTYLAEPDADGEEARTLRPLRTASGRRSRCLRARGPSSCSRCLDAALPRAAPRDLTPGEGV